MERDQHNFHRPKWIHYFNSHAHVERDYVPHIPMPNWNNFNSHAHVERDNCQRWLSWAVRDFNSHAHVERDTLKFCSENMHKISTHTLTWSVTPRQIYVFDDDFAFQLTRSRGAWQIVHWKLIIAGSFQLTRSRGAWHQTYRLGWTEQCISTHTLTWSVTFQIVIFVLDVEVFQLTRSRGAWREPASSHANIRKFQLTRSRGAWRNRI